MTAVDRLVANGNSIISFLKTFSSPTADDVTFTWINDDDSTEDISFANIKKFQDMLENDLTNYKDNVNQKISNLPSGFKNLIINGNFNIWQRGTEFDIGDSAYHSDRWRARDGKIERSEEVPSGQGFSYSMYYENKEDRESINIRQHIEYGKVLTDNRDITLSFWIKGSVDTTCSVDFGDVDNTNFSLTTEWTRVSVVSTAKERNTDSAFSGSLWIDFNLGSDYPDVYITGVQVEFGVNATPFENRPYQIELLLCQRYFYKTAHLGAGVYNTDTTFFSYLQLPTVMRTSPSLSTISGGTDNINIEPCDDYNIEEFKGFHATSDGKNSFCIVLGVPDEDKAGLPGVPVMDRNDDFLLLDAEI